LFSIIKAAITPGTHPAKVNRKTIRIEPQPLPITARGGQKIANITRQKLIISFFQRSKKISKYKS
jgi:hypothetical protein